VFERDSKKLGKLENEVERLKKQNSDLQYTLNKIISHFNLNIKNPEAIAKDLTEKYENSEEEPEE
jgi:hypothetical protein